MNKYIHSVIGLVFGSFGVIALAGIPFVFILGDGVETAMMGVICMLCGILCHAFLSAAEAVDRRKREDIQHELRWRARNNG